MYWEDYQKAGRDPRSEVDVKTTRRRIKVDYELPMKDEYSDFIGGLLKETESH